MMAATDGAADLRAQGVTRATTLGTALADALEIQRKLERELVGRLEREKSLLSSIQRRDTELQAVAKRPQGKAGKLLVDQLERETQRAKKLEVELAALKQAHAELLASHSKLGAQQKQVQARFDALSASKLGKLQRAWWRFRKSTRREQ